MLSRSGLQPSSRAQGAVPPRILFPRRGSKSPTFEASGPTYGFGTRSPIHRVLGPSGLRNRLRPFRVQVAPNKQPKRKAPASHNSKTTLTIGPSGAFMLNTSHKGLRAQKPYTYVYICIYVCIYIYITDLGSYFLHKEGPEAPEYARIRMAQDWPPSGSRRAARADKGLWVAASQSPGQMQEA